MKNILHGLNILRGQCLKAWYISLNRIAKTKFIVLAGFALTMPLMFLTKLSIFMFLATAFIFVYFIMFIFTTIRDCINWVKKLKKRMSETFERARNKEFLAEQRYERSRRKEEK